MKSVSQPPVPVLVADPSWIIRKGIVALLDQISMAYELHEAESARQFVQALSRYKPGLVLVGMSLLTNDTLCAIPDYHRLPLVAVQYPGYGITPPCQVPCCYCLDESKSNLSALIKKIVVPQREVGDVSRVESGLSTREKLVLKHIVMGLTNKEVADRLFISPHTVIAHRKNITSKLGIKTIPGLTIYAILNKLITPGDIQGVE